MTDDELAKVYRALDSLNRADSKLQNGETQLDSEIDVARMILLDLSNDAPKPLISKYDGLKRWLKNPSLTLSFQEIDKLIAPDSLPPTAHHTRQWWGNETNSQSRQCAAWLNAGWQVDTVDFKAGTVTFRKV